MMEVVVFLICLVILGLAIEKMIHTNYDIAGVTMALKQDVIRFVKAVFYNPVSRHVFDWTLVDDIKSILKPYIKIGFEITLANQFFRKVPTIWVRFVPEREYGEGELQEFVQLLVIKFREYLAFYGLSWKIFGTYSVGSDYVSIYIFYAEWESDLHPFINLYRECIRKKTGKTGGILRDEELEAELRNVD